MTRLLCNPQECHQTPPHRTVSQTSAQNWKQSVSVLVNVISPMLREITNGYYKTLSRVSNSYAVMPGWVFLESMWISYRPITKVRVIFSDECTLRFTNSSSSRQFIFTGMFVIAESNLPLVRLLRSDSPTANIEYRYVVVAHLRRTISLHHLCLYLSVYVIHASNNGGVFLPTEPMLPSHSGLCAVQSQRLVSSPTLLWRLTLRKNPSRCSL